ncbi:PLC-like phosphodiesterase [Candidatus Magnetobacterium bavaricum]|uniref:PLC-like phosphodiesterase n=1 Tax=Candidatus Magnetobacterium bavaricum TaxID=29290 RepID=A0A0F3GSK5_9BACT|nr:PLC-like phosphodiesterase [Candidatus Magnetobacterium bavaricum]
MFFCIPSMADADCPDSTPVCTWTGTLTYVGMTGSFCRTPMFNPETSWQCNSRATWMTDDSFIQNATLATITIPGAHDAGMGTITKCSDYALPSVTKTQNRSIIQMLNSGVRVFDFRPTIVDGGMYLGHYSWIGRTIGLASAPLAKLETEGCTGYSVDQALSEIANFVNPWYGRHEVVILKLSHMYNLDKYNIENSYFDQSDFDGLMSKIRYTIPDSALVNNNSNFLTTPIRHLTRNGSVVIITVEAGNGTFNVNALDGSAGVYNVNALPPLQSGGPTPVIFGEYTETNDYDTMQRKQLRKVLDASMAQHYTELIWTLTQTPDQATGCVISSKFSPLVSLAAGYGDGCTSIENLANKVNANYQRIWDWYNWNSNYLGNKCKFCPNVIYVDFANNIAQSQGWIRSVMDQVVIPLNALRH